MANWKKGYRSDSKHYNREKQKKILEQKNIKYQNIGFQTLEEVIGIPPRSSFHSEIPLKNPTFIEEPVPLCPICNEPIQNIAQSFMDENGECVHFDCVLEYFIDTLNPTENQKVSYIGSGKFGLCEKVEDKWIILETFIYENDETHKKMIDYVESLKNA